MIEHLALAIQEARSAPDMPVKIVAIDGYGGSGKTVLANKLAAELNAEILHTDDFASWDNPMDWWPSLVDNILEPIKKGVKALNYPRSSWYKNHKPDPVVNQHVTDIMILEGVSASRREFRPYLAYCVWVETPADICIERGIARDLADSNIDKTQQQMEDEWRRWHEYEEEYVKRDNPKSHADIIVKGTS